MTMMESMMEVEHVEGLWLVRSGNCNDDGDNVNKEHSMKELLL